jgi:nucleotide-binding universal stress UspA family protein
MKKKQHRKTIKSEFKRIIAAIDGSMYSKRFAKKALYLAKQNGVSVTALYVINPPETIYPEFTEMYPNAVALLKKGRRSTLDEIKKLGDKMGVPVKTKLVVGHPDQEIIKEAGKQDLIVLGCKGKSGLERILMGRVCEKVLHHSQLPVLMVR